MREIIKGHRDEAVLLKGRIEFAQEQVKKIEEEVACYKLRLDSLLLAIEVLEEADHEDKKARSGSCSCSKCGNNVGMSAGQ